MRMACHLLLHCVASSFEQARHKVSKLVAPARACNSNLHLPVMGGSLDLQRMQCELWRNMLATKIANDKDKACHTANTVYIVKQESVSGIAAVCVSAECRSTDRRTCPCRCMGWLQSVLACRANIFVRAPAVNCGSAASAAAAARQCYTGTAQCTCTAAAACPACLSCLDKRAGRAQALLFWPA